MAVMNRRPIFLMRTVKIQLVAVMVIAGTGCARPSIEQLETKSIVQ